MSESLMVWIWNFRSLDRAWEFIKTLSGGFLELISLGTYLALLILTVRSAQRAMLLYYIEYFC